MSTEADTVLAWHLAGAQVCSCLRSAPRRIGAFDVHECSTCGRVAMPIDTAAELVGRLLRSGAVIAL